MTEAMKHPLHAGEDEEDIFHACASTIVMIATTYAVDRPAVYGVLLLADVLARFCEMEDFSENQKEGAFEDFKDEWVRAQLRHAQAAGSA